MNKTYTEQFVDDPQNMRLFLQERSIYEVTAKIEEAMDSLDVTRAELARRLGKTKGWVTQLLDGEANKTIRTVADVFAVLGLEFRTFSQPIKVSNEPPVASPSDHSMTRRVYGPSENHIIEFHCGPSVKHYGSSTNSVAAVSQFEEVA